MELSNVIMELSDMSGPPGFETAVAKRACELMSPYVDETYTDVMGNAVGLRRCGIDGAPKVLLDAHLDEIGFVVTGAEDGFLKFSSVGGVDPRMLPASTVKLLTVPPICGVIDTMPPHVLTDEEKDKSPDTDKLAIDAGLPADKCAQLVPPGTPAVYDTKCRMLGEDTICGKALDDRACFASLIRALELLAGETLACDLYVMGSTQEEVGLRGAKTGAYAVSPDHCIIVDVGHGKTPDSGSEVQSEVGKGPVISLGPNMNRAFTDKAIDAAKKNGIEYQIEVEPGGDSGTNATVIQVTREGVATALFSIPLKYMHTPCEAVSLKDCEAAAKLIAATVKEVR